MIELYRKVRFSHPDFTYGGTSYTEYLFGSIGLKVTADIMVQVNWATTSVNLKYTAVTNSIERLDGGINNFKTDGWQVGDTFVITGTVSNNNTGTISSFNDDFTIMYVTTVLVTETIVSTITGDKAITSIEFYPNLVPNNYGSTDRNLIGLGGVSRTSLTDSDTIPKYYADTISSDSANPTVMTIGTNSKGWVTPDDRATIYLSNLGTSTNQIFVISHTFNITPIFLANQLANLQNGIPPAPAAYKDRDCLKYIFTVDAKFSALDPDIVHTTDGNVEFPKGQVGWFNEFVNGRPSVWSKQSIAYSDNATAAGLSTIDYCKTIDVDARLMCQVATGGTFAVQVMYLPQNEEQYINTSTNYKTNFIYEKAVCAIGAGVVQGQNTGDYHFLKNVSVSSISANNAKIIFQIDFSQFLTDEFDILDSDNLNYLIFITPLNGTNITDTNQTAVIMDVNVMECDKDDSTLFQIIDEVQFFEYPHCNGTGYSSFSLLPMDTVIMKTQFHVKIGTNINEIILNKITAGIIAVKQNEIQEFPLEEFSISTSGFLPNCDNVQEIDFAQGRDFIIPTGDCRNEIRLFRMPTLDIAGYSAYEFIYPFKVRWEEWRSLIGLGGVSSRNLIGLGGVSRCFPSATQNWMVYANQLGWTIKFSINAEVEQRQGSYETYPRAVDYTSINPVTTQFEHITWGTIIDPCDMPYAVEFNTLDSTGVVSYEEIIATDADTFVEATITGDFNGYTASQLYGILSLDAWGVGGVAYVQEIGTRLAVDADGVWKGNTAGTVLTATLTKVSNNTMKLSAYLDYDYLPTDTNQFILSAKIREFHESASSSGATCLVSVSIYTFTCGELEIVSVTSANVIVVSGVVEMGELRGVYVEDMILTFVTATTWTASGGTINGNYILSGTIAGNIISAPAHPYTDASVGNTIQGQVTGTLNTSSTDIDGIGDMQIGCTFFVS